MLRAVLDANVYISALIVPRGKPYEVIQKAREYEFQLLTSKPILVEIERVIGYPKIRKTLCFQPREVRAFLDGATYAAQFTPGKLKIKVVKEDPDDDKYLACALEGRADFVVSGDKHLLTLKVYKGIPIVTPAAFLEILHEQQETMEDQAAA